MTSRASKEQADAALGINHYPPSLPVTYPSHFLGRGVGRNPSRQMQPCTAS